MIDVVWTGGVCTVTLDREARANALTAQMLSDLCTAVQGARGAQVLILTGRGRVFSAGADLDAVAEGLAVSPLWEEVSGAVAAFQGLSIAALNGTVAGGAMGLALACDLRVAVPGASVFYPVMRIGVLPQPSDVVRMVGLIGAARAKMVLMAGQKVAAADALAWGLIDRISDDPVAEALGLARDVLAADGDHVRAIKAMFP